MLQFTGDSRDTMEPQYVVYRGGFETKLKIPKDSPPFARVAALDKDGKLLGSTAIVEIETGEKVKSDKPLDINFTLDSHTRR